MPGYNIENMMYVQKWHHMTSAQCLFCIYWLKGCWKHILYLSHGLFFMLVSWNILLTEPKLELNSKIYCSNFDVNSEVVNCLRNTTIQYCMYNATLQWLFAWIYLFSYYMSERHWKCVNFLSQTVEAELWKGNSSTYIENKEVQGKLECLLPCFS